MQVMNMLIITLLKWGGNSHSDNSSFEKNPNKKCYYTPDCGRVWGRLATNRGKAV
jgi:hypothetical protein